MWKRARIGVLLLVLAVVASDAWYERQRAITWRDALHVGIYPIAGDASPVTRAYLASLTPAAFRPIEAFFAEEAARHALPLAEPVRIELYPAITELPPAPPADPGALGVIGWSLRLRYYAARAGAVPGGLAPHVRVFVIYHDPARSPQVPHSLGLTKGRIGVVHAFAAGSMTGSNAVVIAHEFLHTVGATDKYDATTNAPRYPDGYGDPDQLPRYPQHYAEIMAGRRALTATDQEIPASLEECLIGGATAAEIHWTAPGR